MEFTSTERHCSPRKRVSSGLPWPRLWPGTSKGHQPVPAHPLQGFLQRSAVLIHQPFTS